ncbi:MAG: YebC/PmpR family DNA-binding transcriptional regulator [Planctomycetes bacterium]|nr:YebC/PmpR family DNA-binding transcriptional regulator [Planctomycetota bacterium]
MARHSHWAGIKHKKGLLDARRGKRFTKLARLIMSAARTGGGDPEANLHLKYAIERARAASMPKDNIDRAILKGTGELQGESLEAVTYEGYGSSGVAILLEGLTDNRNRTAAEIRKVFEAHGGRMGQAGCVSWLFEKKGLFTLGRARKVDGERLLDLLLEANAEDVQEDENGFEILCATEDFMKVKDALSRAGLEPEEAELTYLPKSRVRLDAEASGKVLPLMEQLEEHEDIQAVHANFELPPEVLKNLE